MRPAARTCLRAAGILALGLALFLPAIRIGELEREEGRRALPAREMLASSDWVVPTIWGRPYLAKPPLYFWLVASCGAARGEVDEPCARLPAALSTALTAVLVLLVAQRLAGARAGVLAALFFLCAPAVWEKGAQGELEATLALFVFASTACVWFGRDGSRPALVGASLALAAALLTKGFPALAFYGAALVGAASANAASASTSAVKKERVRAPSGARFFVSARAVLPLLAGLLLAGVWVALLARSIDPERIGATWADEVLRASDKKAYGQRQIALLVGAFLGFLPGSLLAGFALVGSGARARRAEPFARFALWTIGLSALLVALPPGTRTRYAYPLVPWFAVLGGLALERWLRADTAAGLGARRSLAYLVAAVGVLLAGFAAALPFGVEPQLEPVGAIPWIPLGGAGVVSLLLLARAHRADPRRLVPAALAVLLLLRAFALVDAIPRFASRGRAESAHRIEAALPEDGAWIALWDEFNELSYVRRPLRWASAPDELESGSTLLIGSEWLDDERRASWEIELVTSLSKGREVAVLRRR